jgi:chromosome segregation ATPase
MEDEKNNQDNVQIVKVEQISLSTMDLQQQRMAERLYSQLGLDPVVNKVLKEYKSNLKGMDRATDTVFGPFDIKGRAESAAKVAALMTYSALHQQYTKELGDIQEQMGEVESQRDRERSNYDSLVQKVADVVGGDYEELKANYEGVVDKLSDVEHLKLQTIVLNQEKTDLVQRYESQLAGLQKEKADTVSRYELQVADVQKDREETVSRYEDELKALREEFRKSAEDLRSQIAERGERIVVLEKEKATVIGERESLATQLAELQKSHDDLESRHSSLGANHAKLRAAAAGIEGSVDYAEIRKRMGPEMHDFVLKDSKVPDAVIDGVGKFIDIKKYLGHAVEVGAREGAKKAGEVLKAS